jgi:hypothetical protein
VPRTTATSGAAFGAGVEVVLLHPTPYASDYISLGEVVGLTHQALSQVQCILHHECEDLADEH